MFITALCTKEWRSAARGCGQQIEGHESFLVTSVIEGFCFRKMAELVRNHRRAAKSGAGAMPSWITTVSEMYGWKLSTKRDRQTPKSGFTLYVTSKSRQHHVTDRKIVIQYILNTHIHTTVLVVAKYEYAHLKYHVFCPRAGPSLQTQELRLEFCPMTGLPLQTQEPR